MSTTESRSGLVLELAEEFLERYRKGERPPLLEYVERYPELADEIREVFPAMAMMEKIALADESLAGDPTGAALPVKAPTLEQLGEHLIQALALDELHDVVRRLFVCADPEYRDDIGVMQSGR